MFVRDRMSTDLVTIEPETPVPEALRIMQENNVRRLPVMKDDRLVGIVTELDLLKVSPSPATSLSIYELNYLLAKMEVREIMATEVVTVSPDATIEEAALLLRDNKIGGLPVVENGRLVGIITETNIFDAFIDLFGLRRGGTRIAVELPDRVGVLADIAAIIKGFDINIVSIATFPTDAGVTRAVIRLAGEKISPMLEKLRENYRVTHIA